MYVYDMSGIVFSNKWFIVRYRSTSGRDPDLNTLMRIRIIKYSGSEYGSASVPALPSANIGELPPAISERRKNKSGASPTKGQLSVLFLRYCIKKAFGPFLTKSSKRITLLTSAKCANLRFPYEARIWRSAFHNSSVSSQRCWLQSYSCPQVAVSWEEFQHLRAYHSVFLCLDVFCLCFAKFPQAVKIIYKVLCTTEAGIIYFTAIMFSRVRQRCLSSWFM